MMVNLRYSHTMLVSCLLMLCLSCICGCRDDLDIERVVEGERATVSLQIDLADMPQLSRAGDMNSALENRVNNLWVGVYNVATGQRTGTYFADNINKDFPENVSGTITLDATSGESYIVAVANSVRAEGTTLNWNGKVIGEMKQLLDEADTWDEYRSIAICQNFTDYAVLDAPTNEVSRGLVMQGSYRSDLPLGSHSYNDDEPETVVIKKGTNNLTGKIHLRRLWSQNTINIESEGDIISMEVTEMQVLNVPSFSWLQSRDQEPTAGVRNKLGYANAGDAMSPAPVDPHPNYMPSLKINQSSMDITTRNVGGESKTTYSYSFWQYENKRTGSCAKGDYNGREREFKDGDGKNTGIYQALCPDGKLTLDNNATYIRFKAIITYKARPGNTTGVDEDFSDVTTRTAEGTYVVHLGYIGNDATDFNCYRNARYTYNIKVKSVDKILVEAFRKGENQSGAEGEVNDVTGTFYELDCHFNVFNIYLTREELANFTFTMRTYDNNEAHETKYIKQNGMVLEDNVPERGDADWKYYSWIQFVRNDDINDAGSTTIAPFPELDEDGTPVKDDRLFYLKDIAEGGASLAGAKEGQGFTVYVKEYTYEADYGESGYGREDVGQRWKTYVNQPARMAHFNVSFSESADGESIYYKSKYALAQKSIQTFYNVAQATGDGIQATALGVEHDNETFGLNIRWPNGISGTGAENGRYNTYIGYGRNTGEKWSKVLDLYHLESINAINNTNQTKYAYHVSTAARTCPVPQTVRITSGLNGTAGKYNGGGSSTYDPQSGKNAQFIHALNACMNRNKDENGNGKIDDAELKWYVPSSGKYLQIILGRNSLKSPLMNYEQERLPDGCGDDANTLYHFVSSDNKIIWVDEGASSSVFYGGSNWSHAPWQVRCVRNLGTDLLTIEDALKVYPAYDASDVSTTTHGGVVKVSRYHGSVLREPQVDPLPMHKTDAPQNRISRYGFEIAPRGNAFDGSYTNEETPMLNGSTLKGPANDTEYNNYAKAVSETYCKTLNESCSRKGWRVPNQKEIIIVMRTGVLGNGLYASCTQEHWTNYTPAGTATETLGWKYRITSVDAESNIGTAFATGKAVGKLRCVRDLTAEEAGMSYEQILNYTTP